MMVDFKEYPNVYKGTIGNRIIVLFILLFLVLLFFASSFSHRTFNLLVSSYIALWGIVSVLTSIFLLGNQKNYVSEQLLLLKEIKTKNTDYKHSVELVKYYGNSPNLQASSKWIVFILGIFSLICGGLLLFLQLVY